MWYKLNFYVDIVQQQHELTWYSIVLIDSVDFMDYCIHTIDIQPSTMWQYKCTIKIL